MKTTNSTTGEQEVKSLHILGEWKVCNNSAPYKEIEAGGQRLLQMYGTMATQEANAAHIVKCVNAHDELVKALQNCLSIMKITGFRGDAVNGAQEALRKLDL